MHASIAVYRKRDIMKITYPYFYLLMHASLLILFITTEYGFLPSYSTFRFFISSTFFLIILASATVASFLKQSASLRIRSKRFVLKVRSKSPSKNIVTLLALILVFLSIVTDFYMNGYAGHNTILSKSNHPENLGILNSLNWIQNNILPGETLLVASWGTTPVWSMQFEDRTFASLQVVKEGHVLSYNEIDIDDVVSLAKQLNATYIILDPMIINYGYSKLRPYYDDISSKDIGRKWLSVPEEVKLRKFLEMETADAVEVLYVSESPNKVIIFKCETVAFTTLWCDDTFYDWDVFLNGTMDVKDGSMTLSTPPFCENMVHIAHVFSTQINITENTLMIFKAEYAQNSLVGFSLRFTDDTEALQIFGSPGLYAVHLGEHSRKTLSHIFVYNILKPEVKNTDSVYAVVYSFFALIHYHDANEKNY